MAETPPKIQMLDFGNGILVPADWVTVIPGERPLVVLKPVVLGWVVAPGPDKKETA